MKGKDRFFNSFKTSKVKYGGYAAVVTFAVIVGFVLVNLIVQQLPIQIDLTENDLFTLSEQTSKVIKSISEPVTIYGLFTRADVPFQISEVLEKYRRGSPRISVEYVDPDKNPGLVSRFDESGEGIPRGSLVVEGAKGFRLIRPSDLWDVNVRNPQRPEITSFAIEKRITGALLYVGSGITPIIYEITGHNEPSMAELGIAEELEKENFELRQLNLIRSPVVPNDAASIILFAPKSDLTQGEADKILDYLEPGGRLFIAVDFLAKQTPVINDLLSSYGVSYHLGVVVEPDKDYNTGNPFQLVPDYQDHEILNPLFEARIPVMLQFAQGIRELDVKRRTLEYTPLLTTSTSSFLKTDFEDETAEKSPNDPSGPITVAALVKDTIDYEESIESRIVVVSSGTMLDAIYPIGRIPGNVDFLLNSLTWLQDRKDTIAVRSKSVMQFPMRLTGAQALIFSLIIVVGIPLALFLSGLVVWLRRRHL